MGPCAKQRVRCEIYCLDGSIIYGENYCGQPQETCPREAGEGYEKCKSICQQVGHAEQVAVKNAMGKDCTGAMAVLYGHTYFCMDCQHALFDAGVTYLKRGNGNG